jgi:hypothetical protein
MPELNRWLQIVEMEHPVSSSALVTHQASYNTNSFSSSNFAVQIPVNDDDDCRSCWMLGY